MTRYWIAATLLAFRLGAQTTDVQLTNRDTRSMMVAPGSPPGLVAFSADPSPGGSDLFQTVVSKPGAVVSLLLPDGSEINSSNAQQLGYAYSVVPDGTFDGVYLPNPLAVPGTHTLIQLPPSAPSGQYQIKVDAAGAGGTVVVLASYFSSSPVRAGVLTNTPVYSVGDTVVLSGFVFEGPQPVLGASATVRIVDHKDMASTPVEVAMSDSGPFDAAPGDGIYSGAFKATKAGVFTAALRVTGTSSAGLAFSRTVTTTFRVQPSLAKFASIRDFAVDDNGDGTIDRFAISAKLTADTAGKYQISAALVAGSGARIQSSGFIKLAKGDNNVNLFYSAADVASLGENGPFGIRDVVLTYQDSPEIPLADSRPNAGQTAAYSVQGRATGIQANPAQLDFGSVGAGSSKDLTVTIKNTSTIPLLVGVLPTNSPAFTVINPQAPLALAAGDQQTITVRFTPTSAGPFSGRLVIAGVVVPLSGTAVSGSVTSQAPMVNVSPTALDFGGVNVGQPKDLKVTLSNSGTGALSVTALSTDAVQFTVVSPSVSASSPLAISAGGSADVTVRFTPSDATGFSGHLSISSNDPSRPSLSVNLSGTGMSGAPSGRGNIIRTLGYHEITRFPKEVRFSNGGMPVLSAGGGRVVYAHAPGDETDARYNHIFVVNADGSGQREVDVYKQNCYCGAIVDISADGNTVVSTDGMELRAASATGSAGKRLIANREIPFVRISPKGDKVFFINRRGDVSASDPTTERGLYVINIDGSGLKQIAGPKAVAALLGTTADKVFPFATTGWSLDVSADGSKLVFGVAAPGGERIFTVNADGTGLRQTLGPVDYVNHAALSGNGTKVGYDVIAPPCCSAPNEVGVVNADGSNRKALAAKTPDIGGGNRMEMSSDGTQLLYGGFLYAADGSSVLQLSARGGYYSSDSAPLITDGLWQPTMNSVATRFVYVVRDAAGIAQLATLDINPAVLGDAPSITAASLTQPTIALNGGGQSLVSAMVTTSNTIDRVSAAVLGAGITDPNVAGPVMLDDGTNGDQVAGDGIYTGRISANCCAAPGPKTVRVKAEVRDSGNRRHATAIEFGGLTVVSNTP